MSEVQRYKFCEIKGSMVGSADGDWCHASHIDDAQVELAALREELAELKAQLGSIGEDAGQLRSELEDAESDNETIADHNIELQQRLAAAEQRNATFAELFAEVVEKQSYELEHRGARYRARWEEMLKKLKSATEKLSETSIHE